jgi:hypothetical protein
MLKTKVQQVNMKEIRELEKRKQSRKTIYSGFSGIMKKKIENRKKKIK